PNSPVRRRPPVRPPGGRSAPDPRADRPLVPSSEGSSPRPRAGARPTPSRGVSERVPRRLGEDACRGAVAEEGRAVKDGCGRGGRSMAPRDPSFGEPGEEGPALARTKSRSVQRDAMHVPQRVQRRSTGRQRRRVVGRETIQAPRRAERRGTSPPTRDDLKGPPAVEGGGSDDDVEPRGRTKFVLPTARADDDRWAAVEEAGGERRHGGMSSV
ncbi:hypothetical protein THAOC_13815, partial [Thalassiosira oceanica]